MKLNGNKPKTKPPKPAREKPVRERAPRRERPSKGRVALIVSLAVVAVLLGGAVGFMTYVNQQTDFFDGVRINGVDVGGMSLSQAEAALREAGFGQIDDAAVTVNFPFDVSLTVRAEEVCSRMTAREAVATLYTRYQSSCSSVERTLRFLRCKLGGVELECADGLAVDEAAVRAMVDNAAVEVRSALLDSDVTYGEESISLVKGAGTIRVDVDGLTAQVVDAFQNRNYDTITYEGEIVADEEMPFFAVSTHPVSMDAYFSPDLHVIVPEVVGVSIDHDEAQRLWDAAEYGQEVVIPLIFDYPEVTMAQLEELLFRDKLSTMTTSLWGSSANRINNVKKAAESINDIILMPGEEFSYNPALGKRTEENGYLKAGAYSGGEVVQEYGGGICQVSSTLYYCCLYANLKITARSCHYFPVNYLPAGLDATVSWGGPEYKFVNNREYPVKITAYVDEEKREVTVELWGTDTDGSYVEMKYSTWLVYDEEYEDVAIGYKAKTWRNVYAADGTLLSSREESNSYYHYHDEDIKWPEEEPEEPAEPAGPAEPDQTDAPTVPDDPETPPAGGVMPPELMEPNEEGTED